MLEVLDERHDSSLWRKQREFMGEKKPLTFELLPNRISTTSATFSIYRAKVPGGWLVVSRPHDTLTFLPDPNHEWNGGAAE